MSANCCLLLIAITYGVWVTYRGLKNGTNLILRCAACRKIGTMKKTSIPQDKSYHTDGDVLDSNSSSSPQKYTYTCISCQTEIEL